MSDLRSAPSTRSVVDLAPTFRTKKDWTYLQLRSWIIAGDLEPGGRLDQERLAEQLGVSRFPLRQALTRLAVEGLVLERDHQSAIVAPIRREDVDDVYAGREALETMLAATAVERADPASVAGIGQILEAQRRAIEAGERATYNDLDRQFHRAIYVTSGFEHSVELLDGLRSLSDRYVRLYLRDIRRAEKALRDHEEIFRAYADGDAERIERATRQHIRGGRDELRRILSAPDADSPR